MGLDDLTPLEAVVLALAVYRATLLIVADKLTEPPREAIVDWLTRRAEARAARRGGIVVAGRPTESKLAYLFDCPWCASVYVAAGAVCAIGLWGYGWGLWALLGVLALSAVAGFLASFAAPDE